MMQIERVQWETQKGSTMAHLMSSIYPG